MRYLLNLLRLSFLVLSFQCLHGIAHADTDPPVLKSLSIEKDVLRAGEMLRVHFSADDESGVYQFRVGFWSGTGGNALTVRQFNQDSGVAEVAIPEDIPNGDYSIRDFYISDRSTFQNSTTSGGDVDLSTIKFTIVGNSKSNTTLTLRSSNPVSLLGESITFTAAVTPAVATGSVTFFFDGVAQAPVALLGGEGIITTSVLELGEHAVRASYSGDATHIGSSSSTLTQTVRAQGAVIIRTVIHGPDFTFHFASSEAALNLSITTSGGQGESTSISLAPGSYRLTGADLRNQGIALTSITCSDGDSVGDVENRAATIVLASGETVICTFTSVNSAERASDMIGEFMQTRAGLVLTNQPRLQRRIDRLNGIAPSIGNPMAALMAYLPGVTDGGSLSGSTSLSQIRRLTGDEEPSRFDVWFQGTYGRYNTGEVNGNFGLASLGADYLINPKLLVGAFVQIDRLDQTNPITAAGISGTGWLAGPYLTARLSDNLYLDVLAAGGRSTNNIDSIGTYEESFGATRFLASGALQGEWSSGPWTFSPRARVGWFKEISNSYIDSVGVTIPSVTVGLGQFAAGPGISYHFETKDGAAVETGLRFEGVADFASRSLDNNSQAFRGRFEGTLGITFPRGANVSFSASYDGIGSSGNSVAAGMIGFSIPLQ